MHPAPSVILFTVFSGLGFGLLACLGWDATGWRGGAAFLGWGLGYLLAVGGLMASAFHLGNPQRALLAFTQWRSSWLSREAWASCLTLIVLAPMALSDWLGLDWPRVIGQLGGVMALATVCVTAMIYAQLRTVPRWNHPATPLLFLGFALTGGALLAVQGWGAALLCLILSALLVWNFTDGDRRFAAAGVTLGTATGLGAIGRPQVFEQPHTGGNYLLREMIHVVGRKHARRLRIIAVVCAGLIPALACLILAPLPALLIALPIHVTGALAARWLFFAEAEHVVGLYYGMR